jgi:hypothetical protein
MDVHNEVSVYLNIYQIVIERTNLVSLWLSHSRIKFRNKLDSFMPRTSSAAAIQGESRRLFGLAFDSAGPGSFSPDRDNNLRSGII